MTSILLLVKTNFTYTVTDFRTKAILYNYLPNILLAGVCTCKCKGMVITSRITNKPIKKYKQISFNAVERIKKSNKTNKGDASSNTVMKTTDAMKYKRRLTMCRP